MDVPTEFLGSRGPTHYFTEKTAAEALASTRGNRLLERAKGRAVLIEGDTVRKEELLWVFPEQTGVFIGT